MNTQKPTWQHHKSIFLGIFPGFMIGLTVSYLFMHGSDIAYYYLGPAHIKFFFFVTDQICTLVIRQGCHIFSYSYSNDVLAILTTVLWSILSYAIFTNYRQWYKILLLVFIVFGFIGWIIHSLRSI